MLPHLWCCSWQTLHNTTRLDRCTFTMNSDGTGGFLRDIKEPCEDVISGHRAVDEVEVVVCNAGVGKPRSTVDFVVEPNHIRHVVRPKIGQVHLRRVTYITYTDSVDSGNNQINQSNCYNYFIIQMHPTRLPSQQLKQPLKTFLFSCCDRGELWLTVKAATHKFSYFLNSR